MTTTRSGVPASAVLQGARHVLFVEGKDRSSFDPTVLETLLRANGLARIEVHGIGSCENIHQAAKAMVHEHPSYYFLIDRDGHDEAFVEGSWERFPDRSTHNLLVWRKRELENYFIDPDYLATSQYLERDHTFLCEGIRGECRRRLYTEAVNLVLLRTSLELRRPMVASFKLSCGIRDRERALEHLLHCDALDEWWASAGQSVDRRRRERLLDEYLTSMTGGSADLEYGRGRWLELVSGKQVFHAICAGPAFSVKTMAGVSLQGKGKHEEVARDLLRKPLAEQPADFRRLVRLLDEKLR